MKKILILKDYRNDFYCSSHEKGGSMNLLRIKSIFNKFGYFVNVKNFSEIDFSESFKGFFVLYQSSEDPGLRYKDFIEDVVLGIQRGGYSNTWFL